MGDQSGRTPFRGSLLDRRSLFKSAAVGLGGLAIGSRWDRVAAQTLLLPPPVATQSGLRTALNSRVSRHADMRGKLTDEQLATVLWAAGQAPVVGGRRTIIARTGDGSFVYDPKTHGLEPHSDETVPNALRINYERALDFDAGVSYMFALTTAVSTWEGTSGQLANCPQGRDLNFGIDTVPALTTENVTQPSDGSLPPPETSGGARASQVVAAAHLTHGMYTNLELATEQLSQILWAGYGCTAHRAFNGLSGLTTPSWRAQYFLTDTIYAARGTVQRYCNHQGSDESTRDHRLEMVSQSDSRREIASIVPGIASAPCYVVLCLPEADAEQWYALLESGFVAGAMLLQATDLGVGCDLIAGLTPQQQADLQHATGIPAGHVPHALIALGQPPHAAYLPSVQA